MKKNSAHLLSMLGVIFLSMVIGGSAIAQDDTSSVRGTVVDPQGNAVAGATVTLRNAARGFTRTQTTNESGAYVFSLVPPGTYEMETSATGFRRNVTTGVNAQVDTPVTINVQLEIGSFEETVNVTAGIDAPLNTTDATIGNTFEARRIEELPLNARNIVGLLSLQPGVTRQGEVAGGRRDQANITVDGVDNNEQQSGLDVVTGDAFSGVLRLTPDSVQEFRVVTSVPNVTQGRSSGAQASLVTRSGTNDFHGGLFWFHRNTATTANDWFNNQAGRNLDGSLVAPRPKLLRNIFGGYVGGPIVRDRAFFFYNYEGRRDAAQQSVLRVVPTATLRQGTVIYQTTATNPAGQPCPNNASLRCVTLTPAQIATLYPATGGVNAAALAALQTAPLPNDFTTGDGLNTAGFRFNAPTPTRLETHIARFDFTLTDRQTLFLRGNYQQDVYGRAPAFPNTPSPSQWVHPYGGVIGHTWTLTNTLVNNFRVGLTRQAFSVQGDSNENFITFRFVYEPRLFQRSINRTTPVWNITDDVSWVRGNHTIQFGTNMRFIRNNRETFATAFDVAIINPSFFAGSGSSLSAPLTGVTSPFDTRAAIAAVLGRYSQYSINVNYDLSGQIQPAGSPTVRSFATEEYEFYGQDTWRIRPDLTLTFGLRWGLNTPVYERQGFQVQPSISLGEFFEQRAAAAANGTPLNTLITLNLAGPANNGRDFYEMDWDNFAPQISVAWSPDFGDNWFGRMIGRNNRSVLRGGFRMVYDRIGSALAVNFDLNNALGFATSRTIAANTFNVTTNPGPLFTGFNQSVRGLPVLTLPGPLSFPLSHPANFLRRIENTIDDTLTTPTQYTWNLSYGRELPRNFSFEMSYIGRAGRNLIVSRDVMHPNNLRDPSSGLTWYEAAGLLADHRDRGTSLANLPPIPYFENLWPNLGPILRTAFGFAPFASMSPTQAVYFLVDKNGFNIYDWTFIQDILDRRSRFGPNNPAFFHPQYGAFAVYSTIGSADYHGGSITLRNRFSNNLYFDVNYTLSKSMDDGSNLESTQNAFTGILRNPLDIRLGRSVSNFDIRHNFNANWLIGIPLGRDRWLWRDMPRAVNAILGGWQLTGIFRWHSGVPAGSPFDVGIWATNWNLTSNTVRIRPLEEGHDPNAPGGPNIFSDPDAAFRSVRNARAGEHGDRNILRLPSYIVLDAGLSKTFNMPYAEGHRLQFRWEVFNVTNTQRFGVLSSLGVPQDPEDNTRPADFGRYIGSQTPVGETRPGRVMQFALRYIF